MANGRTKFAAAVNLVQCELRAGVISLAGLVDAFDAEDAGYFADIDENGFELAFIGNFEVGVNTRVGTIGTAFEIVNVGTGAADDSGDFGEKAGTVARADGELDGKFGFGAAAPLDGNAAFRLVHQILDVGTLASVHGDAAASRDVADNFVARNGIAALGAVNKQVVVAFDDERSFAEAQHALHCFYEGGLGVDAFGLRGFFRFTEKAREDLAGGIFSETDGSVKILNPKKAGIRNEFVGVGFINFLHTPASTTTLSFI